MPSFTADQLTEITRVTGAHILPPSFVSTGDLESGFVYARTGKPYPAEALDCELPCRLCERSNTSPAQYKGRDFEAHLLTIHGEPIAQYLDTYGPWFLETSVIPMWSEDGSRRGYDPSPRGTHTVVDKHPTPQRSAIPA